MISTDYHTDDFYQRMLDIGGKMAQGVPMNYGRCDGGPWHAKDMAHAEPEYMVAIDTITKKTIPGMQRSKDPLINFGFYQFHELTQVWRWWPLSAAAKRVDNKTR